MTNDDEKKEIEEVVVEINETIKSIDASLLENKILPKHFREERVAIIDPGKRELWRIYYPGKERLEVRHIDQRKEDRTLDISRNNTKGD